MSQPSNSAVRGSPTSSAASAPPPAAATGDFVVNLCASTTPMALEKPSAPELARYTFFVSRRREEGRERFRLHMGYFASRQDAEQMLLLVRDLYPAAWVGETPGRKLAASAANAAGAATRSSAPVSPATVSGRPAPATPPVETPAAQPVPAAAAPAPAVAPAAPVATARATTTVRVNVPAAAAAAPSVAPTRAPPPEPAAPGVPAASRAAAAAAPRAGVPPASNVREVIAALGPEAAEPAVTVRKPAGTAAPASGLAATAVSPAATPAAAPPAPSAAAAPTAAAAPPVSRASPPTASPRPSPPARNPAPPPAMTPAPRRPPAAAAPGAGQTAAAAVPPSPADSSTVPAVRSSSPGADMTDSQVLRVLEGRSAAAQGRVASAAGAPEARDIALLSPQDTQTWRDIKAQIKRDAVVHFAVQLNWSVTPIDLGRVPSLAIFNAYTLYKIEGNRDGRKWYGLRLGFFSDAVSAKQVAHYVRSEFAQVAVVPVGVNEREQAAQIGAIALPSAAPAARTAPEGDHEFKLIDDDAAPPPSAAPAFDDVPPVVDLPPAVPAATRAPASTNRRPNRPRGAPQSLEETLEILGASQLSIDSGRGERVVLDGRARASDAPTSTFAKLLDRLGEKLRK